MCNFNKIVNGLTATTAMDLLQPSEKSHSYETRSNIHGKFKITKTRTKKLIQHFSSSGEKCGMRFLYR